MQDVVKVESTLEQRQGLVEETMHWIGGACSMPLPFMFPNDYTESSLSVYNLLIDRGIIIFCGH